jgi:hypothetical protein
MEKFYLIVLTIASILLILILTYIGLSMSKRGNNVPFPPVASACPDYWEINSKGLCVIPTGGKTKNSSSIFKDNKLILDTKTTPGLVANSSNNSGTIDFSNSGWSSLGSSQLCAQKDWANKNGIIWDGVNNYNNC